MTIRDVQRTDFQPFTATEAAALVTRKAAVPSGVFDGLSAEAKSQAFRMAGIHKARLIQRARDVVARAIRDGESLRDVQLKLLTVFDSEKVAPPSLARLRLIFRQNGMQAYNDARRTLLDDKDVARVFPFRQYLTVGNGVAGVRGVRPTHAALHGLVFAWNDPFWDSHTPPWEFNCRCTIAALTAGQVKRMGVTVRDLGFVRRQIRVAGRTQRGIAASEFSRGKIDLSKIDKEIRDALEETLS